MKENNLNIYRLSYFLLFSTVIGVVLLIYRFIWQNNIKYLFLIWNIFLSWIPFVISLIISKLYFSSKKFPIMTFLLGFLWLIFYPNAPYIITDYIHIGSKYIKQGYILTFNPELILWYDFVLISLFAIISLSLGFLALNNIQYIIKDRFNSFISWTIVIVVNILSSFAIYLGRFIRFNSWDIIYNLDNIIKTSLNILNANTIAFILLFTLLLTIIHCIFYLMKMYDN